MGYLVRRPDPTDRRAKLIVLTDRGRACIAADISTIHGIEESVTSILGERGHPTAGSAATETLGHGLSHSYRSIRPYARG